MSESFQKLLCIYILTFEQIKVLLVPSVHRGGQVEARVGAAAQTSLQYTTALLLPLHYNYSLTLFKE